ncbi:protein SSUH2 homolog isoform X2 [Ptychodera flava]|uniref:protein SSUH2 homolog isoform X2 n=1 Tax=Ptychodera flava TaxID=63121 RepID=UPI003969FA75
MSEKQPLMQGGGYGQAPPYPTYATGQPNYPHPQGQPQYPGYPPQGGAPQGYPPQGGVPQGYPPQGGAPLGYPPQGGAAGQGYPPTDGGNVQAVDNPTWEGEVPDDDVEDNPNVQAPQPTAPPAEKMDQVSGYDNMQGAPLPPPSYNEAMMQSSYPEQSEVTPNMPTITEDQARDALLQHVSENCCYGAKAARELSFSNIMPSNAFHYILDTFTEKRSTKWAQEPYHGQPIDGPYNGPAPGPWQIEARQPPPFTAQVTHVEVPHTASVKPCHDCLGLGRKRCYHCYGRGRTRCTHCHGRGHHTHYHEGRHERRQCHFCHGWGRKRCFLCHGHGHVVCRTCNGRCQLKCFIRLTIEWIVHHDDHIVERTALPDTLIRGVSGETVFNQQHPRVMPITHFPDNNINQASHTLIQRHNTAYAMERILMQRHSVRVIPVTNLHCNWKSESFSYFVYGFEHRVHAPDYPQQCCCGCSIL